MPASGRNAKRREFGNAAQSAYAIRVYCCTSTAGHNKYESTNNMADISDKIREYIPNLASAAAGGAAQEQAANTMGKTNQLDAMEAQIKPTPSQNLQPRRRT